MADEVFLILLTLGIIALTIIVFSKERWDYISIAILGCVVCVGLIVGQETHADFNFIDAVDLETIMFIFGMQLVVIIGEQEHVFEWVAVKMIRATKGNQRQYFYLTILLGIGLTAFVGDLSVAIIFYPLIIKTCRILEIPSGTYTLGLTICIITGLVMTPFSSGDNIIIASAFNLNAGFFAVYLMPLALGLMFFTVVLLDHFTLKKEAKVADERKLLRLDLLDASVVIGNPRKFYIAIGGFSALFVCLFVFPSVPPFVFALVIGSILVIVTGRKINSIFKHIQWDVIFF